MTKWRGWRARDRAILLITALLHLLVFPLRLARVAFAITFTAGSPLGKKARESPLMRLAGWLDTVGCCPLFDCKVVADGILFRLRHNIDTCSVVYWAREQAVRRVFIPREGEVVVDVGANIGSHTIPASRLVASCGRVIAVEAEPSNFGALVYNLKLNQADNVIPLNLAAWNKEETLDLHYTPLGTSYTIVFKGSTKSVKVRARPLDKVLEELGIEAVDWVKIDVEGAEVEVLQGLEKTMNRSPNLKLIVELHSNETMEKCLSMLKERHYQVQQISPFHILATAHSEVAQK